jgi:hypothetical protein
MSDRDPVRLAHASDTPNELVRSLGIAKSFAPSSTNLDAIVRGVIERLPDADLPDDGSDGGDQGDGGDPGPGDPGPGDPTGPAPAPAGGPALTSGGALIGGGALITATIVAAVMLTQEEPARVEAPVPRAPIEDTAVAAEAPKSPGVAPAGPSEVSAPRASAAAPPPSETALIDAAQRALGSDPAAALRHCAEHQQHYPGGALSQEREVIAIDALVRLGRRADAEARAARFRAQHPSSGHIRRIDVLVGKPAADP